VRRLGVVGRDVLGGSAREGGELIGPFSSLSPLCFTSQ